MMLMLLMCVIMKIAEELTVVDRAAEPLPVARMLCCDRIKLRLRRGRRFGKRKISLGCASSLSLSLSLSDISDISDISLCRPIGFAPPFPHHRLSTNFSFSSQRKLCVSLLPLSLSLSLSLSISYYTPHPLAFHWHSDDGASDWSNTHQFPPLEESSPAFNTDG
jgi:hypothetical protein